MAKPKTNTLNATFERNKVTKRMVRFGPAEGSKIQGSIYLPRTPDIESLAEVAVSVAVNQ